MVKYDSYNNFLTFTLHHGGQKYHQIKSQRDNFTGEASVSIPKDRSFKKITSKDDYLSLTVVKTLFIYHSDAYVSFRSNSYSKSFLPC